MNRRAFTLVELLVVISIIALLSSTILASLTGARSRAEIATALAFERDAHNKLFNSLIGEWTFDGSSGAVTDTSGFGNDGSLVGDASYDSGILNNAVNLDGIGDYVQVSSNSLFDHTNVKTISFWINYSNGVEQFPRILTRMQDPSNGWNIQLINANLSAGSIRVRWMEAGVEQERNTVNTSVVTPNEWYHVLVTIPDHTDPATWKIYINGEEEAHTGTDGSIQGTTALRMGIGTSQPLTGMLDNVRIYSETYE